MIDICIYYKHNIVCNVKHSLFDVSIIEKYFIKYDNKEIINNKYFFYKDSLPYPIQIYKKNIIDVSNRYIK